MAIHVYLVAVIMTHSEGVSRTRVYLLQFEVTSHPQVSVLIPRPFCFHLWHVSCISYGHGSFGPHGVVEVRFGPRERFFSALYPHVPDAIPCCRIGIIEPVEIGGAIPQVFLRCLVQDSHLGYFYAGIVFLRGYAKFQLHIFDVYALDIGLGDNLFHTCCQVKSCVQQVIVLVVIIANYQSCT